jgi:predicted PhzF superfamily epimerase YddE/YHI9
MKLEFSTLGVFTTTRYAGNPVAIIRVPAAEKANLSQSQKQAIASEYVDLFSRVKPANAET